jgi:hypothetical protein
MLALLGSDNKRRQKKLRHRVSGREHDTAFKITCFSRAKELNLITWFILVSFKICVPNNTVYQLGESDHFQICTETHIVALSVKV